MSKGKKTGGRQKGTPNKNTAEIRLSVNTFISNNNEMLIELESGISYAGCLKVNESKWKLSESTFVRYWNTANEKYKDIQNEKNKVLAELSIKKDIDSIQATFDKLEPMDKLKFIDRMLHYTLPKLSFEVLPPPQIKKKLPEWMLSNTDND